MNITVDKNNEMSVNYDSEKGIDKLEEKTEVINKKINLNLSV